MRIGSWNLQGDAYDDARLYGQMEWLAEQGLHVACVQEFKWGDRDGRRRLHRARRILRMNGSLVRSNHHGCHLATFVREDAGLHVVRERHERSGYWHAVNHLEVEVNGYPRSIRVLNVHLSPSSPKRRGMEAETLGLDPYLDKFIVGDFNAAPAKGKVYVPDGVDPEHARRKKDGRAAEAIEAVGFTDVGAYVGVGTPTVGFPRANGADRVAYQCDRIYTNVDRWRILGFDVIEESEPTSDHRLVVGHFNLGPICDKEGLAGIASAGTGEEA